MKTIKMILGAIYILLLGWVLSDITQAMEAYIPIAVKIICCLVSGAIFVWGVVTD